MQSSVSSVPTVLKASAIASAEKGADGAAGGAGVVAGSTDVAGVTADSTDGAGIAGGAGAAAGSAGMAKGAGVATEGAGGAAGSTDGAGVATRGAACFTAAAGAGCCARTSSAISAMLAMMASPASLVRSLGPVANTCSPVSRFPYGGLAHDWGREKGEMGLKHLSGVPPIQPLNLPSWPRRVSDRSRMRPTGGHPRQRSAWSVPTAVARPVRLLPTLPR